MVAPLERTPLTSQGTSATHADLLASIDIFSGLDRITLARLAANFEPIALNPGETVCRQGEQGQALYIITQGRFGVFHCPSDGADEIRVATLAAGDYFGEMALLTGEPRSATVRAIGEGEVLQLERTRLLVLVRQEPSLGLTIAATLSRRVQESTRQAAEGTLLLTSLVDDGLSRLSPALRRLVLEASLLETAAPEALRQRFGEQAGAVAAALAGLGLKNDRIPPSIRRILLDRLERELGEPVAREEPAREPSDLPDISAAALAPPTRNGRPMEHQALQPWYARAVGQARVLRRSWSTTHQSAFVSVAVAVVLIASAAVARPSSVQLPFVLLLLAMIALRITGVLPDFAVSLGLVALWMVLGIATPAQALSGFGSPGWVIVVAILGIAAAIGSSGLLFRFGLLLVRRMPAGLLSQAAILLLTGLILTPLLPSSTARSGLVMPLALTASQTQRLEDRGPESAFLGLASYIGSNPLLFAFLNGSSSCLLVWGLLPEESRARFDWTTWLLGAAPLAALVSIGSLAALWVVFRPREIPASSLAGLNLQLTLLGRPSGREVAMAIILVLTVMLWSVGSSFGIPPGTIGILSLLAAVIVGAFDRASLQRLDWSFLIFYGVVLSIADLTASLGLDRLAAEAVGPLLTQAGIGPAGFVLGIACLNLLLRLFLPMEPALLLLGLLLIPIAPVAGVEPWVVAITLLATTTMWYYPTQMIGYQIAYEAGEARLFSHRQARLVAYSYTVVTLVALMLTLPYWHLLGLL